MNTREQNINIKPSLLFILLIIAGFSIILALASGSISVSLSSLFSPNDLNMLNIILDLRLSRALSAFTTGALLALSGILMQLLINNPLADPYVLGTSSGAALFTLIFMLFGVSDTSIMAGAWLGSGLTTLFLLILNRHQPSLTSPTLVLSGIALASAYSAVISLLLLLSPHAYLKPMLFWLSGDLNNANFPWLSLIIVTLGFFICFWLAPSLDILMRGELQAKALGIPSAKYRFLLFFLTSIFTASAVMQAGCVGFIGLIIPHMARMLFGYHHRFLIPAATLLGGSLLTLADTCARTLFAPAQVPVGIIMTIIGIPFFLGLLKRWS